MLFANMKNLMSRFLQIFVWLWPLPQVLAGCVWCIFARPRYLYKHHHVLLFTCRFGGGVSFGPMAFYSERHREALLSRDPRVMPYINHEYGHSMDSRKWGPLYLPVIGAPSGLHLLVRRWFRHIWTSLENYYDFYTERWANRSAGVEVVKTAYGYVLRNTDQAPKL